MNLSDCIFVQRVRYRGDAVGGHYHTISLGPGNTVVSVLFRIPR